MLSVKLRNRKAAEGRIGAFVAHLALPDDLIAAIFDRDIDDGFIAALSALDAKLAFLATDPLGSLSAARSDLFPVLNRLRLKALARIRDFLLTKVRGLLEKATLVWC